MGHGEIVLSPGTDGVSVIRASGAQTGGAYSLRQVSIPPGRRVPMHRHSRESEAWFVLQGELTFDLENEAFVAGVGAYVHLPVGVAHSFRNSGEQPAMFLEILSPPDLERYFEERAQLARPGEPGRDYAGLTPEEHHSLAQRYGLTFLERA
jgi:quercetin dioxygenase-like cupin family protein